MGNGALSGLPEDVDEQTASEALGEHWNPFRWKEIVGENGTIKLSRLKAECKMRHAYPANYQEIVEFKIDERVEQEKSSSLSEGFISNNYPPNHPKSRANSNTSAICEGESTGTKTTTATPDVETKDVK
jgi:hypothetical protein